jgi:hypothetical protein
LIEEQDVDPLYDEELTAADRGESLVIRQSLHTMSTKEEPCLKYIIIFTQCTTAGNFVMLPLIVEVVRM